ncbi:MAG: aspartate/glutamate racemase family protein [Microbacteriaceae bacterium]|nr:aspartate/glutamate racemase family protein [Microbacteriaceae bacterium]
MKRIGLLGGMSWQSSALYYALINEFVAERLGGFHSADCVMASVDFATIEAMQVGGRWDDAGAALATEARALEAAGAEMIVLCTNTMHKVADQIQSAVRIPLLHLGDVTAAAVLATGIDTVGLLGTRFTMEESFYVDRMRSHGLEVVVPEAEDRAIVNRVIYDELVAGSVLDESRAEYVRIIDNLRSRGAQGVILGCTEIELLIGPGDITLPVFPTTRIHAEAAVTAALS